MLEVGSRGIVERRERRKWKRRRKFLQ